jgi:hypothetical protein
VPRGADATSGTAAAGTAFASAGRSKQVGVPAGARRRYKGGAHGTAPPHPRRIEALDRRVAAVHEAGHYVVARHFGLRSAAAWIVRQADVVDPLADKLWIGSASYSSAERNRLSTRRAMMYGVAGAVAEEAWDLRGDPEGCDWSDAWDFLQVGGMSDTDWNTVYSDPSCITPKLVRAVEDVRMLLQPDTGLLWGPLCTAARALMRDGFCEARPGLAAAAREHVERLDKIQAYCRDQAAFDGAWSPQAGSPDRR